MKRILCVRLVNWPICRVRRRSAPPHETGAYVLVRTVASRQLVVAVDAGAFRAGIRPGFTLTQARALRAEVAHGEYDPVADRKGVEALARWLMRFTPVVAPAEFAPRRDLPPDFAVWMDATGCERLYGGLAAMRQRVVDGLGRLRVAARTAIAPTAGGAWALASDAATDGSVAGQADLARLLAPLPLQALRLDEPTIAGLHHLGVNNIGQLSQLPREALPGRFGPMLLRRLDQAHGVLHEPLAPLAPSAPVQAALAFEGSFGSLEAVFAVFQELIGRIIEQLTVRGCGARRLKVELLRSHGAPWTRTIELSRPSRHRGNLFNLFRCCLDALRHEGIRLPDRPGRRRPAPPEEGIRGMRLSVPAFERLHERQALLNDDRELSPDELAHLVERLRLRLGQQAIARAARVESYLPERAYRLTDDIGADVPCDGADDGRAFAVPRPLHLLSRPREIRVMVSPSHDRDGRPVAAGIDGATYTFTHAIGPERIAGEWWRRHDRTRDYFDVQTDRGRRLWLFRVTETSRWYWHGIFA